MVQFSCHGSNDWQQPLDTGLFIAHDEPLTVRDTTNQTKADYFAVHVPELRPSGETKMGAGVAANFFSNILSLDDGPDARSFAHSFWWAAFTFTGV